MFVDYIDVHIMIVVQFVDSTPMFAACSFISVSLFVLKYACLDSCPIIQFRLANSW